MTSLEGYDCACFDLERSRSIALACPSVTAVTAGCPTDRARSGHGLGLRHHGDVDLQHAPANLRFLLNEWDPIGVADLVQDEYDCLIAPVLKVLISGWAGRGERASLVS